MNVTCLKATIAAACLVLGTGIAAAQSSNSGTSGSSDNTGSFSSGSSNESNGNTSTSPSAMTAAATNTTSTAGGASGTPVGAVPEPETYAMMALGLGLLGYVGRRRKNRDKA